MKSPAKKDEYCVICGDRPPHFRCYHFRREEAGRSRTADNRGRAGFDSRAPDQKENEDADTD